MVLSTIDIFPIVSQWENLWIQRSVKFADMKVDSVKEEYDDNLLLFFYFQAFYCVFLPLQLNDSFKSSKHTQQWADNIFYIWFS